MVFPHLLIHPSILRSAIPLLIKDYRYESFKQGYFRSLPLQFISLSIQTMEWFWESSGEKTQAQACQSGMPR
jgi:hypothetical protein